MNFCVPISSNFYEAGLDLWPFSKLQVSYFPGAFPATPLTGVFSKLLRSRYVLLLVHWLFHSCHSLSLCRSSLRFDIPFGTLRTCAPFFIIPVTTASIPKPLPTANFSLSISRTSECLTSWKLFLLSLLLHYFTSCLSAPSSCSNFDFNNAAPWIY